MERHLLTLKEERLKWKGLRWSMMLMSRKDLDRGQWRTWQKIRGKKLLLLFFFCTVTTAGLSVGLSSRFHPNSRRLFPFYFSNFTLRTYLLTFGVTGAVFEIAGEMRRLLAYFDNPAQGRKWSGGNSSSGKSQNFILSKGNLIYMYLWWGERIAARGS